MDGIRDLQVVSVGEALIDFVATRPGCLQDVSAFNRLPGGAAANVAVGLARLGIRVGMIGKVGQDEFGFFLRRVLEKEKVDTRGLLFSKDARTTLAFVSLTEDGERGFLFYRHPGADERLCPEDIDESLIADSHVLHLSSLSLTSEPARSAALRAMRLARRHGLLVTFDPNLRPSLWRSERDMKTVTREIMRVCDVVKLSASEVQALAEAENVEEGSLRLVQSGVSLVIVTLAGNGCHYRTRTRVGNVEGYEVVAKDTTGAGDGFLAGFLAYIVRHGLVYALHELGTKELERALQYANAVGAMVVTGLGAISSLPCNAAVSKFLTQQKQGNR